MAVFDDVILEWDGKQKTVPAQGVMRMLAKIEDHLTLHEMQTYFSRGTAPMVRVSSAYAAALQHAGFQVSDDEVYARLMSAGAEDDGALALSVIENLQTMMVPPADLDVKKPAKQDAAPGKSRAANNSSKRRTKQQSD